MAKSQTTSKNKKAGSSAYWKFPLSPHSYPERKYHLQNLVIAQKMPWGSLRMGFIRVKQCITLLLVKSGDEQSSNSVPYSSFSVMFYRDLSGIVWYKGNLVVAKELEWRISREMIKE